MSTESDALRAMIMPSVEAYAAQVRDDATAPIQAAFEAFKAADVTEDAAYQAEIDRLNAVINANTVEYPGPFVDFAQQQSGLFLGSKSIVGKGVDKTVYQMQPMSSTKKAAVDALVKGESNQYRFIRSGGFSPSTVPAGIDHHDFTIRATDQGHAYGGLTIGYAIAPKVTDVKLQGFPGFDSGPPGETFSLALWRTTSAVLTRVLCDGRHPVTGAPQAASLFATNDVVGDTNFVDTLAQWANVGFGVALWHGGGSHTFTRSRWFNNRKHINIERSYAGVYRFVQNTFDIAKIVPYVAQCTSDPSRGSSKITFEDCVVQGGDGVLRVRTYGSSATNCQLDSDIRCIQNGKDVTNDPTKFQIVHAG